MIFFFRFFLFMFFVVTLSHRADAFEIDNEDFPFKDPFLSTFLVNQTKPESDYFMKRMRTHYLRLDKNRPAFRYSYWKNRDSSALAVVIPGMNASCRDYRAGILAEMFYARGYSVVVVSSSMHWTFVRSALSAATPGYVPSDASDMRNVIAVIVQDLEKRNKRTFSKKVLAGISLGGIHSLFIADQERQETKIGLDWILALNPIVDFGESLNAIDRMYVDSLTYLRSLGAENWNESLFSLHISNMMDFQKKQMSPPLFPEEMRFLLGLYFKRSLMEFILVSRQQCDLGVLSQSHSTLRRQSLYDEAELYDFDGYVREFVMRYYQDHAEERWDALKSKEEILAESSLRRIADTLRQNQEIKIIHTTDDPLNGPDSIRFLKDTLSEDQLYLYRYGGHVGLLASESVRETIRDLIP
ncbi:MAG: hypothetical protein C4527_25425 [Candidatus Omnitrophota bacterium]|nr:MAG: hypothetical protein C4527_25425 [Candidatus Omnitrophota bacterium]